MQVLARTLSTKSARLTHSDASAKIGRYQSAWAKVNPQSRADYTSRLDTIDKLRRSKQFTVDVLRKFIPVYAVEAGNQLEKNDMTRQLSPTVNDFKPPFSLLWP